MSDEKHAYNELLQSTVLMMLERFYDIYHDLDDEAMMGEFDKIRISIFPEALGDSNVFLWVHYKTKMSDDELSKNMIKFMLKSALYLSEKGIDYYQKLAPNDQGLFMALKDYYYGKEEIMNQIIEQGLKHQTAHIPVKAFIDNLNDFADIDSNDKDDK